jgi:hypothetical protein
MTADGFCIGCFQTVGFRVLRRIGCDFGKSVTYEVECPCCKARSRKTVTLGARSHA